MTIPFKRNILLVGSSLFIGGAEMVISNLCRNLNKNIFNVTVCHLKNRGVIGDELHNLGYEIIGIKKAGNVKTDYFTFLRLRRIIKQKNIHILHSHTTYSLADSSICKLTLPNLKLIHTFHFGNYPKLSGNNLLLEKCFWRVPDRLIAVGNVQRVAIQKSLKIPNHRITTIWNGIEKNELAIDDDVVRRFSNTGKIIIGSLSNLIEQKGLPYLLNAAALLRKKNDKFILLVVGDGPLREELEAKCRQLGLQDTVYFLGWIENAATRVLPVFDIFVQSSLWEAMSMVLLEAMGAGKPVVATNVGENRHVIDHGENGFIVEPDNIDSMVEALEKLMLSKDLRIDFGLRARQKYEKYFTSKIMAQKYEKAYMEILSK